MKMLTLVAMMFLCVVVQASDDSAYYSTSSTFSERIRMSPVDDEWVGKMSTIKTKEGTTYTGLVQDIIKTEEPDSISRKNTSVYGQKKGSDYAKYEESQVQRMSIYIKIRSGKTITIVPWSSVESISVKMW